ncbi:hypothetical protein ACV35T_16405, partial [Pseudomonas aeruginosa]
MVHLLDRYSIEGPRTTDWLASGVVKRHRTLGSLLNLLIGFGLSSQTGGGVEPLRRASGRSPRAAATCATSVANPVAPWVRPGVR